VSFIRRDSNTHRRMYLGQQPGLGSGSSFQLSMQGKLRSTSTLLQGCRSLEGKEFPLLNQQGSNFQADTVQTY